MKISLRHANKLIVDTDAVADQVDVIDQPIDKPPAGEAQLIVQLTGFGREV